MSAFFRLTAELDVLTPLFLGGASQKAELRTPSIKGAMRFWYRALDPDFQERERRVFGSGGKEAGQSLLLLRCSPGPRANERMQWQVANAAQFNQGTGRQTRNGLAYLGYPLAMKGNGERTAIVPGARFTVEVTCRRTPKRSEAEMPLRAALASLWALGHFGALGTRARRGFGALALTGWRLEDQDGAPMVSDELGELPLLCHTTTSPNEWVESARRCLAVLKRWFGTFEDGGERADRPRSKGERSGRRSHACHLHFGPQADFVVGKERVKRDDWRGAVLSLGRALQEFRQRKQPDYDAVKDYVLSNLQKGGSRIQRAPERATFGLPLTFRYGSVPGGKPVTFAPVDGDRHGSPLFLRPVLVGDTLSSLFLRMDGDVPGIDTPVGIRGTDRSLDMANRNAMDEFIRELKGRVVR